MNTEVKFTYKSLRNSIREAKKQTFEMLETTETLITGSIDETFIDKAKSIKNDLKKYITYLNNLKKTLPKKGYAKDIDAQHEWLLINGNVDGQLASITGGLMKLFEELSAGTNMENDFKELTEIAKHIEDDINKGIGK